MAIASDILGHARDVADQLGVDVYLFNGRVSRSQDLDCVEAVHQHFGHQKALLIVVTNGGDPDAAYKIARYFQDKYEAFSVFIPGLCKSAGTLLAIGAHDLIFAPFGELGPLDIQLTKVDKFDQMQSGLTIQDALDTLERRARVSFYNIIKDYMEANNGLISFATASKAASDFVTQLYGPIFARIDPEEVGARSRSMRIATEYGARLAIRSQNLRNPAALKTLAETYSSHSFVIDRQEAESLFIRTRAASDKEMELIGALGRHARFEGYGGSGFVFVPLSTCRKEAELARQGSKDDGQVERSGDPSSNGGNPAQSASAADSAPQRRGRGRQQSFQDVAPSNGGRS